MPEFVFIASRKSAAMAYMQGRVSSILRAMTCVLCVQGQNLPFSRPLKFEGMHLPFKSQQQDPKIHNWRSIQHYHRPVVVTLVLAEATTVATAVPTA